MVVSKPMNILKTMDIHHWQWKTSMIKILPNKIKASWQGCEQIRYLIKSSIQRKEIPLSRLFHGMTLEIRTYQAQSVQARQGATRSRIFNHSYINLTNLMIFRMPAQHIECSQSSKDFLQNLIGKAIRSGAKESSLSSLIQREYFLTTEPQTSNN